METKMLDSWSRSLMIKVNKAELQVGWKYLGGSKINILGGRNFSFIL